MDDGVDRLAVLAADAGVTTLSQALAETLTYLEWKHQDRTPALQDTTVYNSLLRLQKELKCSSFWELLGRESDGPLVNLSVFEIDKLEQTMDLYITAVLNDVDVESPLFFPLADFFQSNRIILWRILEKISSVKLTPETAVYQQKLTDCLKKRIHTEVDAWLSNEIRNTIPSCSKTVSKDIQHLTEVLQKLDSELEQASSVVFQEGTLFEATSCDYFELVLEILDETLYPACSQIMESMDSYQDNYKSFHVNLKDSCALSHSFYLRLKKLVGTFTNLGNSCDGHKLGDYESLFTKCFMTLLQVIKSECHQRIDRAVSSEEKDTIHGEEKIYSSAVIILNSLCTVLDECKRFDIDNDEMKIAFVVKITDVICDGAKIYSETMERRFDDSQSPVGNDSESQKKMCILANSVEHVRAYLENLPEQLYLNLSENVRTSEDITRILSRVHQSMDLQLRNTVERLLKEVTTTIHSLCHKNFLSWIESVTLQSYDKYINGLNICLKTVHNNLKDRLFKLLLSLMWSSVLLDLQTEFKEGKYPDYSKGLKDNIEDMLKYFLSLDMEESTSHACIKEQLFTLLEFNSKSTIELQLDYYSQIAESIVSPVEYMGHLAFQAGYKATSKSKVDLHINVLKGQRLPARKFEMSDLRAELQLCPSTLFPQQPPPLKSRPATGDPDSPVFNQHFEFCGLPLQSLEMKGAVLQIQVVNQDKSFSTESVLLLQQVQNMSGFTSLDFLPVYLMPLRKVDSSQMSYQILERRSQWDSNAKCFINSRNKPTKSKKTFFSCIRRKRSC